MRKILGGILGTIVIVIVALFLLSHFGLLSWGNSNAEGDVNKTEADAKNETVENEDLVTTDSIEEVEITIIVTQDKYLIDEQEVTLTQIKERVTDESAVIEVILENNYASAKAWDDIKANFEKWGVVPIEQ